MYDLVVIGGGPAGYLAAARARAHGLRVALIERRLLGGECTNWGCIPTKALIDMAEAYYKIKLLSQVGLLSGPAPASLDSLTDYISRSVVRSREGIKLLLSEIDILEGWGRVTGIGRVSVDLGSGSTKELETKYILIATGSEPRDIPSARVDGEYVITNREFFELRKIPESIVIIGAGAIGVEIATALAMLGKEVYLVEILERPLYFVDPDISSVVERYLRRLGIKLFFKSTAKDVIKKSGRAVVNVSLSDGSTKSLEAEKVLVAIGRKPNVEGIGLEIVGVEYDLRNGIRVNESMVTSVPNILAAGDVTGPPQLAHKAFREALIAVDTIVGSSNTLPKSPIPYVVFSYPQVALVGITEDGARAAGINYRVFKFPYVALGRNTTALAKTSEGFAKILVGDDWKILGAQIVGNEASEVIHIFSLAIAKKMNIRDLAEAIYSHPTYSEIVSEISSLALGKPLHLK